MSTQDLIKQVCEVTGIISAEQAASLLSVCGNNVEAAVSLFFEGGPLTGAEPAPANEAITVDDDDVRAPIAPIREQLIMPEDDNFGGYINAGRISRVQQRVKVCPLRDFAREAALMEEQMEQAASTGLEGVVANIPGGRSHRRARASAMVAAAQSLPPKAAEGLGALFRPPTDIAYAGAFAIARQRATEIKRFLLVNVQDDSFNSQVLNRDVWSDKELRKLIRRHFMLWQVDSDSSEGRRFVAFYHCGKLPYVCVIDPRTGEEIWKSSNPNQTTILPDLKQFIIEHKDFCAELMDDENAPSTSSKRPAAAAIVIDEDDDAGPSSSSCSNNNLTDQYAKKRSKIMELSEQEQIALAIRNSMHENGSKSKNNSNSDDEYDDNEEDDFGSVEEFVEDDVKAACERTSYEENLGTAKDELTMLKLRLLDTNGSDEVIQLRWPSDTKFEVLRQFITQCHAHISKQPYKLICAFPRKTLESEHDIKTLKELGLHPSANLHVNLDD